MEEEKITPNEGEVKTAEKAQAVIENNANAGNEAEADATTTLDESSKDEAEEDDVALEEEYMVESTEDAKAKDATKY